MGQIMSPEESAQRALQAVQARSRATAPVNNPNGKTFLPKEPYHEAHASPPPEAYQGEKLWEPPKHASLIDRQPKHPHANEGKATVLKA